jgi:ribosome-interacting GTPase 1
VDRHGAGQVVVVGMPNAGKSALVGALTDARVNVAPFPFATHAPVPGMMPFEDIQIQLVDMPPFTGDGMMPGMMGRLRACDCILACLDLAAPDLLEQSEVCFAVIRERGLVPEGWDVPEDCEPKRTIIVGTKAGAPDAAGNLEALVELQPRFSGILPMDVESGIGLDELPRICFDRLDIVRVYTKLPGQPADLVDPFTLPAGSTVTDMARAVHRELAEDLRYVRVWGSAKFDGQSVQMDHVLQDRDIVELHVQTRS